MDTITVGQPCIEKRHRIVKTSELTYFKSDPRHIFEFPGDGRSRRIEHHYLADPSLGSTRL